MMKSRRPPTKLLQHTCLPGLRIEALESRLPFAVGSLDPAFGTAGTVSLSVNGYQLQGQPQVNVQTDGKLIVSGIAERLSDKAYSLIVIRLNTDGSFDTTFGTGGVDYVQQSLLGSVGGTVATTIEPEGTIVSALPGLGTTKICLVRFNTDGTLDSTFGTGGISNIAPPASSYSFESLYIQHLADGSIWLAADGGGSCTWNVFKVTALRTLDSTYGNQGEARINWNPPRSYLFSGFTVQADGEAVLIGSEGTSPWTLVAFTPAGQLDTSFGNSGIVSSLVENSQPNTSPEVSFSITQQNDGNLVVFGSNNEHPYSVDALGYTLKGGAPDPAFNGGLPVIVPPSKAALVRNSDSLVQQNGKLLVASGEFGGTQTDLIRFNSDGSLDTSFGAAGHALLEAGSNAPSIALAPDGGILVASNASAFNDSWGVIRVLGDPVNPHPWQNPTDPDDVNNSGNVTPIDALLVLNHLNAFGAGPLVGNPPGTQTYYDVNGDNNITPIDALLVLNRLNSQLTQMAVTAVQRDSAQPASAPAAVDLWAAELGEADLRSVTDDLAIKLHSACSFEV